MDQTDTYQVQLIIISDQPSLNLCPLFDSRLKPNEIIMATPIGDSYLDFQHWMAGVCLSLGIKSTVLKLPCSQDAPALRECFDTLITQRSTDNQQLILNCSCGPKPIGIIAHQVFYQNQLPVFFVMQDQVHWLNNPQQLKSINLEDKIQIPAFLASHGLNVTALDRQPITKQMRSLANGWINQAMYFSKSIGILNYYANRAQKSLTCHISNQHLRSNKPFATILSQLHESGLIVKSKNKLTFTNEQSRFFANGGWLEDQVFSVLLKLQKNMPKLQDIARNVEIQWRESSLHNKVTNELDVIVLYENRLIVIECKTKRFTADHANNAVYKLGAMIKHLGGTKSSGVIVSFQQIPAKHCERAKLLDIDVCQQQNPATLEASLTKILTNT